jgi:hypothetical protein
VVIHLHRIEEIEKNINPLTGDLIGEKLVNQHREAHIGGTKSTLAWLPLDDRTIVLI